MTQDEKCKHQGQITVTDQEWVSGDCMRLDVECEECGRKGSLVVVLDPKLVLWESDATEQEVLDRGHF
jgi:hypothetical protein